MAAYNLQSEIKSECDSLFAKQEEKEKKSNEFPQRDPFKVNFQDKKQLIADVHHIANHMFPLSADAAESGYSLKQIGGGYTNLLFLLTPKTTSAASHKFLVRVYGANTELLIDREREEKLLWELGEVGFAPKLFGLFGNGRMEQWYDDAETLELNELRPRDAQ